MPLVVVQLRFSTEELGNRRASILLALSIADLTEGLVAYWSLDDKVKDDVGKHNGKLEGGAKFVKNAERGKVLVHVGENVCPYLTCMMRRTCSARPRIGPCSFYPISTKNYHKSMPQQQNNQLVNTQGYKNLLQELKDILAQGHYAAYKAVDNIRVQTYWQMGERIVREELKHKDRADYGEYLITNLARDLGIKRRDLYNIVRFYRLYPIVSSVSTQLSWTHYRYLITLDDDQERTFYQNQAILHSWSIRELQRQIKNKLFENAPKKEIEATFKTKLPAVRTNEVFRDTYDFNFIELEHREGEKALEDKILSDFEKFLKELGEDFAILGRQVPIKIDNQTHYIDLVLYHIGIPCRVLVDLKIGKLDSRDIGQMNKYIGYYRRNKQYEHEKDTIGLIICKEAGREEVMYALDGLEKKIFIAKYKVKLPSEEKIKKAIKSL